MCARQGVITPRGCVANSGSAFLCAASFCAVSGRRGRRSARRSSPAIRGRRGKSSPGPPVASRTLASISSKAANFVKLKVSVAPSSFAKASRLSLPSTAMILSMPIVRSTASTMRPIGPQPWTRTLVLKFRSPVVLARSTAWMATAAGSISMRWSSESPVTLKKVEFGRIFRYSA